MAAVPAKAKQELEQLVKLIEHVANRKVVEETACQAREGAALFSKLRRFPIFEELRAETGRSLEKGDDKTLRLAVKHLQLPMCKKKTINRVRNTCDKLSAKGMKQVRVADLRKRLVAGARSNIPKLPQTSCELLAF